MSVPPGIVCTQEQYLRYPNDPSLYCLTPQQRVGLTWTACASIISLLAVLTVFMIILRNVARHIRYAPSGQWRMVQEPMDIFMLSLFFADLIQAIGAAMSIKWASEGTVEIGSFCTAQGIIKQFGAASVALTTLVIAVFTFIGIWWGRGARMLVTAKITIGLVWLFVILIVAIPNIIHHDKHQLYIAPTPFWCWIGPRYLGLRIVGEYLWLWVTLFISLLAYIPLFFWSRGNITISDKSWWKFSIHRTTDSFEDRDGHKSYALTMIAYPLLYSVLVLPLSIVRWTAFIQERGGKSNHIAPSATFAAVSIFSLSGATNVVLLFVTRPNSLLFGRPAVYIRDGRAPSLKSLGKVETCAELDDLNAVPMDVHADGLQLGRLPSVSD